MLKNVTKLVKHHHSGLSLNAIAFISITYCTIHFSLCVRRSEKESEKRITGLSDEHLLMALTFPLVFALTPLIAVVNLN